MKYIKYKPSYDESLDNIGRAVSDEVRGMLKDEMAEKISENPRVTVVDYNDSNKDVKLGEPKESEKYFDMYSHTTSSGEITENRTTPAREQLVKEIYKDGSEKLSTREDFEKKISAQSVSNEEKTELSRIVRISSPDSHAYSTAENRSKHAIEAFNSDKYIIEQVAAGRGIPPSLLSSVYFKKIADDGTPVGTVDLPTARAVYYRSFGQELPWDDNTLNSYLQTPQGILDFMAIGLQCSSNYLGYNLSTLSKQQMSDTLSLYARWFDTGSDFESIIMSYNNVFDDIYKKMPAKDYDVKLV